MSKSSYIRPQGTELARRLSEPRRMVQVLTGARQVGKTTLVLQLLERDEVPHRFVSADEPTLRGPDWLEQQWEAARHLARDGAALLVVDEAQKVPHWSEAVKRLWDEDSRHGTPLKVLLLGSAPLLVQQGLTESLAGRFETLHLPHWSFGEMREAFGWSLPTFLYFGGYPGAATLVDEPARWARYVHDSLIETTIARDVLLHARVDKPALLRRLFELACRYSGQILSYTKMVGQLQDAGNTTTLAHYLHLLDGAGMVTGLQKYAGEAVRTRASSPKLQVHDTALMSATVGLSPEEARADAVYWGRLVESAVGAHLVNGMAGELGEVAYWRDRGQEVDYVVRQGATVTAVEVKSGRSRGVAPGMQAFDRTFGPTRKLLVGGDGIPLETFLVRPAREWLRPDGR